MRSGGRRAFLGLCTCLAVLATAAPAHAAELARASERLALLRAAAESRSGELVGLRVGRGGRARIAPLGYSTPARVLTVRSSLNRAWALLVASPATRADLRQTFLLRRRARWQVVWSVTRGSEGDALCRRSEPGTAVALDLGLPTYTSRACRHRRDRRRLVRRMQSSELTSVRGMVEWKYNDNVEFVPGPVQPDRSEVTTSDCAWDGRGSAVPAAYGEVARANPRWGTVILYCVAGYDGFAYLESPTVLLVSRAGRAGGFTKVHAHTLPSWTSRGTICWSHRWPVPPAPRVALEFCTPFPGAIRDALR